MAWVLVLDGMGFSLVFILDVVCMDLVSIEDNYGS